LLSEQDRLNEIEPLERRALAIREKVLGPEHPDTVRSSAGLGWVLAKQGHYDEAEPIYRRAIAIVRKVDESLIQLTLDAQLGALLFEKQGKPLEALPYYREAADVLDRLFAYTGSGKLPEEARYTFLEQYAYVYPALIGLLLQLHEQDPKAGYDREILAVASRNQSRIFSELLRQADVKIFAADPTFVDLKNRRELLEQRLSLLREKYATVPISAANADSQRAAFSEQIKQAESELQALEQRLWKDYPRFMELVQPRPVTVDDLQKRLLRPGEALLGVVVLPKRTVVLVITPEHFLLHPVDLSEQNLADRIRQIRQSLKQPGQQVNTDLLAKLDPAILHDLYQNLFAAPVEEALKGAKQVLVVAAGPLYSLPLELLVTTYGETEQKAFKKAKARAYGSSPEQALLGEYATLSYLGDRYRFSYLPSLSALVSQRDYPKKPVPIQRELIAFADPIFGMEAAEATAEPASTYSPATQATLRGLDRSGANPTLNRLPHTADEVNDIAHLFTDQPAPYLRDAAQEHTAKDLAKASTLQGLRYLIFATHGLLGGEFLQVKTALETQPMPIPDRPLPVLPKEERAQPALALTLVGNRL